ncbi:zinc-binding dehydrogenase [Streptomyces sp. NBC_01304]|uniref:zinc-binding dehydrogenase n=1 Tax=Streptomyces sp. NBC_01304 TaxID=2903818 RepID=UPI002E15D9E9|nr:zinc-binding dehydrogenase [Streptomyces sp. NBC_01304]
MRVAQVTKFGGPEVIETIEAPDPVAGPGEVVIDVAYVDTIFVETQIRSGWGQEYFPVEPPYVPGNGVAGTVREVGEGVDEAWIGRCVVSSSGFTGGSAERVARAVDTLTPVPAGLELRDAAALMTDAVTALGLLDVTGVEPGEKVLLLGASGGMGTLLVQLLHARGAEVVAVARGEHKLALVRELGADHAIDATYEDWPEQARKALGGGGADVVLDGVGGRLGTAAFPLAADGGRFSAHGAPTGGFAPLDQAEAERRGITLLGIGNLQFDPEDQRHLRVRAYAQAAEGRLRPIIGEAFPLDRTADAHTAIEARTLLGKVLLAV